MKDPCGTLNSIPEGLEKCGSTEIEIKNKHFLLYRYRTVSKEESCVLMSQKLSEHQGTEQQVSDNSQELNVNNSRELHMHAKLSALPKNKLKIMKSV